MFLFAGRSVAGRTFSWLCGSHELRNSDANAAKVHGSMPELSETRCNVI
jgi:hypothetical protein